MAENARPRRALQPNMDRYRRSLLTVAWLTVALAVLHLADHALRGARVHSHALDPTWDHSGWPFKPDVTPYTFSLIAVALILGIGLIGTYRRKLWAGYWLGAAIVLGAIVTIVHLPTADQEARPSSTAPGLGCRPSARLRSRLLSRSSRHSC